MRVGRRTDGQTAAAQRGAFAPCAARQLAEACDAVRRCVARLAERQLAERHAVRRCVAQLAVRPSAARHAVRRCVVRAPRAVRALREGQALREARELQERDARLALLLLAYAAVARLRSSPSQQKR
jgi:hypothetical protein